MRRFSTLGNQRGSALALALMALLLLSALAISLATQSLSTWDAHDQDSALDRSSYVARAGLERACADILLVSDNWATVGHGLLYDAEPFADGDFDVEVIHASRDKATVEVRGRVGGSQRVLRFDLERLRDPGGGNGNGNGNGGGNGNGNGGGNGNGNGNGGGNGNGNGGGNGGGNGNGNGGGNGGGNGNGNTTGVRVAAVHDITIANRFG